MTHYLLEYRYADMDARARARAEQYDWGTATRGFLAAHGALERRRAA